MKKNTESRNLSFGQQSSKVKQLADTLGQAISMQEYHTGELLPSINQLSTRYQVSRDTVFKAFLDLRERGLIDSTPGKGYYVTGRLLNVLLLLDEYSPFKDVLYNSFIRQLPINKYKVDLLFHQYNERLFNTILRESAGRYNKYIIMNFDNEKLSKSLSKIETGKLLLLDFGKFDKTGCSYLCQDFDEAFYHNLTKLSERFKKYQKVTLLFWKHSKHPQSSKNYFLRFCQEQGMESCIQDNPEEVYPEKRHAYIAIRPQDIVTLIKNSRINGLKCGTDFGVLAYNDTPSYEIIEKGITALTVDWVEMGEKAAAFVRTGNPIQEYLSTQIRLRNSL